jgi:hypothetical protein
VELLTSILIVGILGGVVLMALWFSFESYFQLDDYTSAESEMEYAIQRLSRDFTMIGLGMPNNRKGTGSFFLTFSISSDPPVMPVMAFFGSSEDSEDSKWGGPVTVANTNVDSKYDEETIRNLNPGLSKNPDLFGPGGGAYVGPELYYAWAVPTGAKARFSTSDGGKTVEISEIFAPIVGEGIDFLKEFPYDGISGKFDPTIGANSVRKWLLFPTLRLPMRADKWTAGGVDTTVAPGSENVRGVVMGLDELHLIQAARLFRNDDDELVKLVFDTESSFSSEVLARGVVGLQFTYNPDSRLLTMYVAARGTEGKGAGAQPPMWPSWLPPIASSDLRYRILTRSLTWRIRN